MSREPPKYYFPARFAAFKLLSSFVLGSSFVELDFDMTGQTGTMLRVAREQSHNVYRQETLVVTER
jgi:hypothetical protein